MKNHPLWWKIPLFLETPKWFKFPEVVQDTVIHFHLCQFLHVSPPGVTARMVVSFRFRGGAASER